jgi:radical SAM superfamily enzyme YgiQ (UPF0313 family)
MSIVYSNRVFRPPAEADSLILQLAIGCPHNTCRFCAMYKGVTYRQRSEAEMLDYVAEAAQDNPETRRIFLADGDMMILPFPILKSVLEACNRQFPKLARISTYANASSIIAKSPEQLRALHELKLSILYMGMETGDAQLLAKVLKNEDPETMVRAVQRVQQAGLKASVMVLLGLGGQAGSARHIELTAAVLNRMQPRLLSALLLMEVPGVRMYEGYQPIGDYQSVCELRDLLAGLELRRTVFSANHSSIPFPVQGRLPRDKQDLIALLEQTLTGLGS